MKRIKFLIFLVVFSILGSCLNADLFLDQKIENIEDQSDIRPELSLPYRILGDYYDHRILTLIRKICDNPTGYRLLDILSYSIRLNFIPTDRIPGRTMEYAGEGYIYYNDGQMNDDEFTQLLFHELFHAYQTTGNQNIVKSLNDEIEAYLAQYYFCESMNIDFSAVSNDFVKAIRELAKYAGYGIPTDYEKYNKAYKKALKRLKEGNALYDMPDWEEQEPYELNHLHLLFK